LKGNPYIINDEQIQVANAEDGTLGNLNTTQAQEIAGAHVMDNVLSTRNGGTEIIYSSYNDFEYLYRVNDEIYSSATWNSKALGNEVSVPTENSGHPMLWKEIIRRLPYCRNRRTLKIVSCKTKT